MKIDIRARDIDLSASLREHIERRLFFALGRFGTRITVVTVTLEDLNGPRGGVDKQCRMVAAVTSVGHLRVEVRDTDTITAVDCAADRLGRTVAREIDRYYSHPTQRAATARIAGDGLFQKRT